MPLGVRGNSGTTWIRAVGQDLDSWIATRQGRWGTADEVAAVAVHLASDEASFTSGLLYHLDNGARVV